MNIALAVQYSQSRFCDSSCHCIGNSAGGFISPGRLCHVPFVYAVRDLTLDCSGSQTAVCDTRQQRQLVLAQAPLLCVMLVFILVFRIKIIEPVILF
jgi:hypothetical protein